MKITTSSVALLVGINLVLIRIATMKKLQDERKLLFKMDKLKAIVFYLSWINKASNKIAEAKHEKAIETAKKRLATGLDMNLVSQCTGLTIDEVKKLM